MAIRTATMIVEHIENATDAEIGERIRALVAKGFTRFIVESKPDWMTRDRFLPVGETEERDKIAGMTREEWSHGTTEAERDG